MGRKGVSKRKPKQNKSNPFSNDKSVGSVTPLVTTTDKSMGSGTAASSADRKKKSRKG